MSASLAPCLLLAVPQMADPNFSRTVVFLIDHSSDGAFGLVVNRPTEYILRQLCDELNIPCSSDARIFQGGPVQTDRGWVMHTDDIHVDGTMRLALGLNLNGTQDVLRTVAALGPGEGGFRVYMGYSGWGPGQLEAEINYGSWIIGEPALEHILYADDTDPWDGALRRLGLDPALIARGGGAN